MTGSANGSLKDKTVLVIGRGSGLARAIALAALDAEARVIAAGRDAEALSAAGSDEPGVSTETVDLTDEASIAALGERLGTADRVVFTASAPSLGRQLAAASRPYADRRNHAERARRLALQQRP
jgi:NAD(P)-dependent dehydrogenase (short-subunit alcohol dehydrogenase family)